MHHGIKMKKTKKGYQSQGSRNLDHYWISQCLPEEEDIDYLSGNNLDYWALGIAAHKSNFKVGVDDICYLIRGYYIPEKFKYWKIAYRNLPSSF